MPSNDSYVLASPQFVPTSTDDLLVTPTGGTQGRLADKLAAGGGGGGVLPFDIAIDQLQLTRLASHPLVAGLSIPAGKIAFPISMTLQYQAGTAAFEGSDKFFQYQWTATGEIALAAQISSIVDTTANRFFTQGGGSGDEPASYAALLGSDLELATNGDLGLWGPIASSTLSDGGGGAGYASGDTGNVTSPGGADATYTVTTVDGDGDVLTYTLDTPGNSFTTATDMATVAGGSQPGAGTGFMIDVIVSQCETGTALVTGTYILMDALA